MNIESGHYITFLSPIFFKTLRMVSSLFWYTSTITQWQTAHNNLEQGASNGKGWDVSCWDQYPEFWLIVLISLKDSGSSWHYILRLKVVCCSSHLNSLFSFSFCYWTSYKVSSFRSWCYSDIRAAAEAVMRRCHEDEQDDLGSAHPHLRCLGPHGRRGLCQVE